jgi:alpha-beta hydrolase superfamily lysophospholipase
MTCGLVASINRNISRVQSFAYNQTYPYLVVIGEQDTMVDNSDTKRWHFKTASKCKKLVSLQSSYHELTKEPNNHQYFENLLTFMDERICSQNCVKFGSDLSAKDIR